MPNVFDDIILDTIKAYSDLGESIAADVRDSLSTPVGVYFGPRGGQHKIRSNPGESPRMGSGRLRASIEGHVEYEDSIVRLVVDSNHPGAFRLEREYNRPFLVPALVDWTDRIIEASAETVEYIY